MEVQLVPAVVRRRGAAMSIIHAEEGVALGRVDEVGVLHERTPSAVGEHADRAGLRAHEPQRGITVTAVGGFTLDAAQVRRHHAVRSVIRVLLGHGHAALHPAHDKSELDGLSDANEEGSDALGRSSPHLIRASKKEISQFGAGSSDRR